MSLSVRSRVRKSFARKVLRSWFIQGIGWYAMWETMGRVFLELGFVVALALFGLSFPILVLAWLVFHTAAWFLLYGGFLKLWVLREVSTDVDRLRFHRDRVSRKVAAKPYLRVVFLRGSAARGKMSGTSDIDICAVPERGLANRVRGLLFWWALRAGSVLRGFPLEARWIDAERYVPYHVIDETPLVLKAPEAPIRVGPRDPSIGTLIALSGMDGSGKTTVADRLVSRLQAKGLDAVKFYGHRWDGRGASLAVMFESIWRRVGGKMDRLQAARASKAMYDAVTFADYLRILMRLSRVLRPNRIVVTDRYVCDVIAFLRVRGPVLSTVEGLLVGASYEPDLSLVLELPPDVALTRKQEWSLAKLDRFSHEYADLRTLLRLTPVDATLSADEVLVRIEQAVDRTLRLATPSRRATAAAG